MYKSDNRVEFALYEDKDAYGPTPLDESPKSGDAVGTFEELFSMRLRASRPAPRENFGY